MAFLELAVPASFDEESGEYLAGCLLDYSVIEYAGASSGSRTFPATSIMLRSPPFIHYCEIRGGGGSGVFVFFNHNQTFKFTHSRVENHRSALEGAGLRVFGGRNHVVRSNVFASNVSGKQGGGVYLVAAGAITLTRNVFAGNQASQAGGGIYMITAGSFDEEGATTLQTEVRDNLFLGNSIVNGGMNAHGAGMFLMGEKIRAWKNEFRGNWLLGRDDLQGGGLYVAGIGNRVEANLFEDNVAQSGGALGVFASDVVWVNDNVFRRNVATTGLGGAAYIESLNEAQFVGNVAEDNDAPLEGGGVYIQSRTRSLLIGNTLRDNRSAASGGGVYLAGGVSRLESNVFDRNVGGGFGGGLYFHQGAGGMTTFMNNTFLRNTANDGGGGTYLHSPEGVAADIRFVPPNHFLNNGSDGGGGVYVESQGVALTGAEGAFNFIVNNDAEEGSGIYNALPFEDDGSGDVDARFNCWGAEGGFVPDRIHDHLDDADVGMVLFEPTAECCQDGEGIDQITCQAQTDRNVLMLVLSGGTPGNVFFADLPTGETTLGAFNENGIGRAKFKDVNGSGVVTVTSGCGTVFEAGYDCPE